MSTENEAPTAADPGERLAAAVRSARRGFRRDTEALIDLLDEGVLLVALAKPVDEDQAPSAQLTLSPKLVTTDSGEVLLPVFTSEDRLGAFAAELGWATRDDELSYFTLSVRGAFDAALDLVRDQHCNAVVIDPADDHELLLQPRELDALRQGQAVPLVGYVRELPVGADEQTVVSELDNPPDPALLAALDACIARFPSIVSYRLQQTLNRERDIDPHPTLTLLARSAPEDREALHQALFEVLEGALPAPGYVDVVFELVGDRS